MEGGGEQGDGSCGLSVLLGPWAAWVTHPEQVN